MARRNYDASRARARRAANRDRINQRRRELQAASPARARESSRKYRMANPEKCRERQRKFRAANRDKIVSQKRKWRADNRERINAARNLQNADPQRREKARERYRKWAKLHPRQRRPRILGKEVLLLAAKALIPTEILQRNFAKPKKQSAKRDKRRGRYARRRDWKLDWERRWRAANPEKVEQYRRARKHKEEILIAALKLMNPELRTWETRANVNQP